MLSRCALTWFGLASVVPVCSNNKIVFMVLKQYWITSHATIVLLSLAAAFKLVAAADTAFRGGGLLWTSVLLGLSCAETLVAFSLFKEPSSVFWRLLAATLFFCFSLYTIRLAILGISSCSCLGVLSIPPLAMTFIDMTLALLLLRSIDSYRGIRMWTSLKNTLFNDYPTFISIVALNCLLFAFLCVLKIGGPALMR